MKNYEIRFKTTQELQQKVDKHYLLFSDLKKSSFYEKVFLLGLQHLQGLILAQKPDILSRLSKLK